MIKDVVALGDKHCGHQIGLTPPDWWRPVKNKYGRYQRQLWGWYSHMARKLGPVRVLIDLGDIIQGRGSRSGGVELITTDRGEQAEMAAESAALWHPERVVVCHGTRSHTGEHGEDWEKVFCRELKAKGIQVTLDNHASVNVNGVIFDAKHKVGRSEVPHARYTPLAREMLWSALWTELGQRPKAHIILRGHAHYYLHVEDETRHGFITPMLCALGDAYGSRECPGTVSIGVIHFPVKGLKRDGSPDMPGWDRYLLPVSAMAARTIRA